ncbi:MAG: hypothetical protein R3E66_21695 [bacterium]
MLPDISAHADDNRCDVVLAAGLIRECDAPLGRLFDVFCVEKVEDRVIVLEVATQAVRTQQKLVAAEHVELKRVDLDEFVDANRTRHGVFVRQ